MIMMIRYARFRSHKHAPVSKLQNSSKVENTADVERVSNNCKDIRFFRGLNVEYNRRTQMVGKVLQSSRVDKCNVSNTQWSPFLLQTYAEEYQQVSLISLGKLYSFYKSFQMQQDRGFETRRRVFT